MFVIFNILYVVGLTQPKMFDKNLIALIFRLCLVGDTHTHTNHSTKMGLPVPREGETKQKGMTRRAATILAPPHIILPNLNIFS